MSTIEKMSVHKALAELKIIDSRIERSIDDAQFCVANKHSNEKINGIPVEDAKKLMVGHLILLREEMQLREQLFFLTLRQLLRLQTENIQLQKQLR